LFILLRTQQYLAVDGALRCLTVYWRGRPISGGNNHLLYFFNVFAWMKTLSLAGIHPKDAFDFVRLSQWMNALAAAGSISMLWLLCAGATESMAAASIAAGAYALSNAFVLHATSTAEPMVGLFWSLASVVTVVWALTASSRTGLFIGGALLLLAMATYESMVLIGPAELLLIYYWDDLRGHHNRIRPLWFLAGCLFGGLAAYVPAYALSGSTEFVAIWRRFTDMGGGEQVYGGVGPSKLINLPFGFANSLVASLPRDYQGIRSLLRNHTHDRRILIAFGAVLLSMGWLVWTVSRLAVVWAELTRRQRIILASCAVALIFDISPLIFWDPLYDKLWLQPLAVILLAGSIVSTLWQRQQQWPLRFLPETLLIALIVTRGLARSYMANRSPLPCLDTARHLAETLHPSDLLVTEWDPVSQLYSAFWGNGANRFDVPSTATANGPETLPLLEHEMARTQASRGRIFFLGVLDMPEADWKPYLEDKCHLPYHSFDGVRRCATPIANLDCADTHEILWQLSAGCYKP
jgi:hypothetical protein